MCCIARTKSFQMCKRPCCKVVHQRLKASQSYVSTNLHYAGFAGADYDLQDALVESTNKSSSRGERHGQSFYDYELAGPVRPSRLSKHQLSWLHPIWHAWHQVLVPACDLQRLAELTCVS